MRFISSVQPGPAGGFIQLGCVREKGGSSFTPFLKLSLPATKQPAGLLLSFSTIHMPTFSQPLCLLFYCWSGDYPHWEAVWISCFPL